MTPETFKAEFERWATSNGLPISFFNWPGDGSTYYAWIAWQEATRQAEVRFAAILRDAMDCAANRKHI